MLDTIARLREAEGKEAFGPYSAYRRVGAIPFLEKRNDKVYGAEVHVGVDALPITR